MSKRDAYELLETIGEGAYGKALLAKDGEGNKVVVKVVDLTKLSAKDRVSCITEVQALAKLEHPFIVRYLDSFLEGVHLNIVMTFCKGGDLASLIRKRADTGEPFPEEQVLKWLAQLLMAVKFTHANRILHRDIKSQNVFLDADGRLRLADFGISKALDSTLAEARTFIGTPFYLSPELCEGAPYGAASDIWATGCVAFEIATFKTPFHDAKNLPELCHRICNAPIPRLPSLYSSELRCLVASMLKRNPRERPSAAQLLEAPLLQGAIRRMLDSSTAGGKSSPERKTI